MTARWCRIIITTAPEHTDAVAAFVVAETGNGVEEPAVGMVCTTVTNQSAAHVLGQQIMSRFTAAVAYQQTDPVDWSLHWRDGIAARRFGRLILTPTWLAPESGPDDVVVVMDPESAFGSGEHGSTRGALALLERHLMRGDRVLDLGSGSGILSIAAVKLGAACALGIEVDDESVRVAEVNATRNQVDTQVRFALGDAEWLAPLVGPVQIICSNILRTVNTRLAPMVAPLLGEGGTVIFAGMEESEEALFRPVLGDVGLRMIDAVRDDGWWSVAARRA